MSTYVIGISGASGAAYGIRLIEALVSCGHDLHLVFSATARGIVRDEVGLDLGNSPEKTRRALRDRVGDGGTISVHGENNLYAEIASGSVPSDGMVVAPCSMKTVAAIAHGFADGLIARAADVHMKEGRPLILVPREAPLSTIHLENLLAVSKVSGVRVVPAMPGFYTAPQTIDDLIDFIVARILDNLGVDHRLSTRWSEALKGNQGGGPDG